MLRTSQGPLTQGDEGITSEAQRLDQAEIINGGLDIERVVLRAPSRLCSTRRSRSESTGTASGPGVCGSGVRRVTRAPASERVRSRSRPRAGESTVHGPRSTETVGPPAPRVTTDPQASTAHEQTWINVGWDVSLSERPEPMRRPSHRCWALQRAIGAVPASL